jgi:tRNA (adenine37-N6)-methyltransferase
MRRTVNESALQVLCVLDGTPLLDIKPYVTTFDVQTEGVRIGWLEKTSHEVSNKRSDQRFNLEPHNSN